MSLCYSTHALPHAPATHGVQSDKDHRKIHKITGQASYPRFKTTNGAALVLGPTQKNGRKWPGIEINNRAIYFLQIHIPKPIIHKILSMKFSRECIPQSSGFVAGGERNQLVKIRPIPAMLRRQKGWALKGWSAEGLGVG